MPFNYKDLTYIRASIQAYEGILNQTTEEECEEEKFSEIQDDIMYLGRLLALVNQEIEEAESSGPSLNPVRSKD
ncbi:hypothetical protein [uncultured Microbulbifer sp.]|uniref:hypothetical protein n=1 Tax=uncultured Microbulbifer sp. TaxID=348147 RepID=UPI002626BDDD|nr:hypothetical protein [uncultured Microbulbifer sp.]